jgi:hypothetical protein
MLQLPLVHWLLRLHEVPMPPAAVQPFEPSHQKPVAQFGSLAPLLPPQFVPLQVVASWQDALPGHAVGEPATQLPLPSHVLAVIIPLAPAQEVPQGVLFDAKLQAPPALQVVAPQVPVAQLAAVQQLPVPLVPQLPDVQSLFSVHEPVAIGTTHAWLLQKKVDRQSPSVLQLDGHEVPVHLKFPVQAVGEPAVQLPLPSQALDVSSPVPPLHEGVPQAVPLPV